jgi:hypothetical protein
MAARESVRAAACETAAKSGLHITELFRVVAEKVTKFPTDASPSDPENVSPSRFCC